MRSKPLLLPLLITLLSVANGRSVQAQTVTRLTQNQTNDVGPSWDPRGNTIAYSRQKSSSSSIYDAYGVNPNNQGGEQPLLTGNASDFGVAVALSWIGSTGALAIEEAISGFEVLRFDTALAPYNRTVANGSDAGTSLLLAINGGGGGGILKISRNGDVALIRVSTSGSGGQVSVRTGLVANMTGQVSSTFGTSLLTENVGSDPRYMLGGALNADGSVYILPLPLASATSPHDLYLAPTSNPTARFNLTNDATSGFFNVYPDISPDGTKVAFARGTTADGPFDLYTINVDGTGLTQLTSTPNFSEIQPSWSPDGKSLTFAGVHLSGHSSEEPALQPGEPINYNIYRLTLPGDPIVTPKTILTEPPAVVVVGRNATFTFAAFSKAQKAALPKLFARAKKPAVKFTFRYQLTLQKQGGKKNQNAVLVSKRNKLTAKKLAPGTYLAKYRVEILQKNGSKISVAGRTKFSPVTGFVIS